MSTKQKNFNPHEMWATGTRSLIALNNGIEQTKYPSVGDSQKMVIYWLLGYKIRMAFSLSVGFIHTQSSKLDFQRLPPNAERVSLFPQCGLTVSDLGSS